MTDLVIPDLRKLVRRDLVRLAFGGLSPQTTKLYEGDWRRFLEWAQVGDMDAFFALDKLTAADTLNRYLRHLAAPDPPDFPDGRKPATRARAKQAICSVSGRLYGLEAIPWTLAGLKALEAPKVRYYKDIEGLPREAWLALLSAAESGGPPRNVRDVAVLLLLHDSALRRREVASLKLEDYDGERLRVSIWGKGRDPADRDAVPISPRCAVAINVWIASHRDPSKKMLFTPLGAINRTHDEFYDEDVNAIVRYWCRKAGVPEVGPHQLRHAAITQAAREGTTPIQLQSFARHESFDITKRYIHTAQDDARHVTEMLGEIEEDED